EPPPAPVSSEGEEGEGTTGAGPGEGGAPEPAPGAASEERRGAAHEASASGRMPVGALVGPAGSASAAAVDQTAPASGQSGSTANVSSQPGTVARPAGGAGEANPV